MTLTPLEAALIAGIIALAGLVMGAVFSFWQLSGRFVTRIECSAHRDAECAEDRRISDNVDGLTKDVKRKLDVLFRMVRACIQFLPIEEADKARILNTNGGG